jgi:hypothetical protein
MSNTLSAISASSAQDIQLQTLQQDPRKANSKIQNDPAAGAVEAATVAIQRNQNTARVENQLQQQLTATQASNITQIRGQSDVQVQATQATPVTTAAAIAPSSTTAQEQAAQRTRQQNEQQSQAQLQQQQINNDRQVQKAAQQAATERAPNPPSNNPVSQYQATQELLQSSGSNTHQVYTRA